MVKMLQFFGLAVSASQANSANSCLGGSFTLIGEFGDSFAADFEGPMKGAVKTMTGVADLNLDSVTIAISTSGAAAPGDCAAAIAASPAPGNSTNNNSSDGSSSNGGNNGSDGGQESRLLFDQIIGMDAWSGSTRQLDSHAATEAHVGYTVIADEADIAAISTMMESHDATTMLTVVNNAIMVAIAADSTLSAPTVTGSSVHTVEEPMVDTSDDAVHTVEETWTPQWTQASAQGLSCNVGQTYSGCDAGTDALTETDCGSGFDRCYSVTVAVGDCSTTTMSCSTQAACDAMTGDTFSCCEEDNCNSGATSDACVAACPGVMEWIIPFTGPDNNNMQMTDVCGESALDCTMAAMMDPAHACHGDPNFGAFGQLRALCTAATRLPLMQAIVSDASSCETACPGVLAVLGEYQFVNRRESMRITNTDPRTRRLDGHGRDAAEIQAMLDVLCPNAETEDTTECFFNTTRHNGACTIVDDPPSRPAVMDSCDNSAAPDAVTSKAPDAAVFSSLLVAVSVQFCIL